jgi:hypothetical protein
MDGGDELDSKSKDGCGVEHTLIGGLAVFYNKIIVLNL